MAATSEQQTIALIILYGPVVVGGLAVVARTIYVLIRRRVADNRRYPWPKVTWLYHVAFAVQGLAMAAAFLLFSCSRLFMSLPRGERKNILWWRNSSYARLGSTGCGFPVLGHERMAYSRANIPSSYWHF